jgi:hypothetical protein
MEQFCALAAIDSQLPTQEEHDKCEWIYMTCEKLWGPYDDDWMQCEVQAIQAAECNEPDSFQYSTNVEHAAYDHHGCPAYING